MKIMTVFGTRPEAIKMAPLVKKLNEDPEIESVLCVTAQHRQMLDQVMDLFELTPDYDLNIMKPNQTISMITANVLTGLEPVLQKEKPDMVLVHGDTSTTFVTALACFYQQIPVGHVEAGLRTYDKYSPFPEEINRVLTGHIAELHFAPTERNRQNLLAERISDDNIIITGNTVIDALLQVADKPYEFEDETLKAPHMGTVIRLPNYDIGLDSRISRPKVIPNPGGKPPGFRNFGDQICYFTQHFRITGCSAPTAPQQSWKPSRSRYRCWSRSEPS